jgi:hypothetical protein
VESISSLREKYIHASPPKPSPKLARSLFQGLGASLLAINKIKKRKEKKEFSQVDAYFSGGQSTVLYPPLHHTLS